MVDSVWPPNCKHNFEREVVEYIKSLGIKADIYTLTLPSFSFCVFTINENVFKKIKEVLHKDEKPLQSK